MRDGITLEPGSRKSRFGRALAAVFAAFVVSMTGWQAGADEIEKFYKDKQLTLILSAGTGGGFNEYGRTFAAHFLNHLPGPPSSIVVQHMTGAGGIVATNHLYQNAAQDGTTIGFVHSAMVTADILMPERVQFDTNKIHWVGSMDSDAGYCISWHTSDVKTYKDLKESSLILGSAGVGSTQDIHARILKRLWAPKSQIVSGYKDGSEVYIAMERGEVDGRCGVPISSLASTRPDWLSEKKVNILILFGLERDPRYPDIPTIIDLVEDPKTEGALELILAARSVARPVLAPPGVPAERVAALRKAFMQTMQDPKFLSDAKARNLTIEAVSGERMQTMIKKLHSSPRDTVALATELSAR